MKQLFTTLIFTAITITAFSQNKLELGLYTEGSLVMEKELIIRSSHYLKSKTTWGTGLGIYASVPVWWRFSLYGALGYRYAQLLDGYAVTKLQEDGDGYTIDRYDYEKYKHRYLVAPINIRFNWPGNCLISGGIETCWMLNDYDKIKNIPEYNWCIGFGSQKHKLKWNLQYIWGLDKQEIQDYFDTTYSDGSLRTRLLYNYRTKRLQLTLTYPLWSK